MELLFEFRKEIVARNGRLIPLQNTAEVTPEPVLRPDSPQDGGGVALYGSVMEEGGRLRMWYQAAPRDHTWDSDFAHVAYAESRDGIEWTKPNIGSAFGNAANLTNLGLHSPSVMKTKEGFMATGCAKRSIGLNEAAARPGYYLATSADGLDWQIDTRDPLPGGDVITGVWDARVHRGEACCKYLRFNGGMTRRALFTTTFDATGWQPPRLALLPGEADDAAAMARGCRTADYYGMSFMPAGKTGMVGFVWMFYHQPPYFKSGAGMFGGGALVLAYREEPGAAWVFASGRKPFVEHPAGIARNRFFYAASSPITLGDEQRLYCTAFNRSHGWMLGEDRKRAPSAVKLLRESSLCAIHLASWKRDRLCGFRAETEAEFVIQAEGIPTACKLVLNYKTDPGGWIKVRVAPVGPEPFVRGFTPLPEAAADGFDFDDCVPLEGDSCSGEVIWRGGANLPANQPLLITVRMFMAECYAYEIDDL